MRRRKAQVRGGTIAAVVSLVGCRAPTQITVDVSTNVPCAAWKGAAIAVGELGPPLEAKPATTTSTYCDASGHLGTLIAVPSGENNAAVAFRVVGAVSQTLESCTANAGVGCIVARRALNFIPHESLSLSVPLVSACEGVPCDPLSTCIEGQCRPATIPDPANCADQTCGEGALPPSDAGAGDATLTDGSSSDGEAQDGAPVDASAEGSSAGDASNGDSGPTHADGGTFDASFASCGTSCALALGEYHTCVMREGGVVCWGQDYNGETGNDPSMPGNAAPGAVRTSTSNGANPLTGVRGIVAGESTSCAYMADGSVACWGAGSPTETADLAFATTQPQFAGSLQLAMGNYHMCEVTPARAIVCQAAQANGVEPATYDSDGGSAPVTLAPPAGYQPPFPVFATTAYFTCLLTTDGLVYCLGDNMLAFESNPSGSPANVTTFTQIPLAGPALELALMVGTGCARTAGHVFCWGDDTGNETGGPTKGITEVTYADGGALANAVQLAAGSFFHGCARLASGQVACWGRNVEHQLGRGEPVTSDGGTTPFAALVVDADGGAFGNVAYVASGAFHSCALKTDGSLWCWGDNSYTQLGQGSTDMQPRSVPTFVNQ